MQSSNAALDQFQSNWFCCHKFVWDMQCINPSHMIQLQYKSMYIQYTLKVYICILNYPSVMMLCSFRTTSFTLSLDRLCFQFQASPRIPCGRVGPISMSPSSVAKRSTVADLDHAWVTEGNQQFVTDTCHAGCEAKTKLCETSIVSLGKKTNSKGDKLPAWRARWGANLGEKLRRVWASVSLATRPRVHLNVPYHMQ